MGISKSDKPLGSFYLKNGPKENGNCVVYLRYFINGRYATKSTFIEVPKDRWDQNKQIVKGSSDRNLNEQANRLNARLKKEKDKIDSQIEQYDGKFTYPIVMQMLKGDFQPREKKIKETEFVQYALGYNQQRYDQHQIAYSTWNNARLAILAFKKFLVEKRGRGELYLNEIEPKLFEDYKTWRVTTRGNSSLEGINKTLTPLFKAVKDLAANLLIPLDISSNIVDKYLEVKQRVYDPTVETHEVHYLTPEQLAEFIKLYPTVKYNRTRDYMDMFLFSFYACGLRISDLVTLEWSQIDFEKQELTKMMYKTKSPITIPLTDNAIEILVRWKKRKLNSRFVFNLLDEDFDITDIVALDNARLSKNKAIQTSLRGLGDKLGLPFHLTIHVARHTFAVLALKNGVDVYQISKFLGHKSIAATEKTYAEYLPSDMKKTLRDKLQFDLPAIVTE